MDMTFNVFGEAIFQLAQLWVEEEDEVQYATFLDALLKRITKELATPAELLSLDDIVTLSNSDGSITVEGVKTKNPFRKPQAEQPPAEQPPEPDQPTLKHKGPERTTSAKRGLELSKLRTTSAESFGPWSPRERSPVTSPYNAFVAFVCGICMQISMNSHNTYVVPRRFTPNLQAGSRPSNLASETAESHGSPKHRCYRRDNADH